MQARALLDRQQREVARQLRAQFSTARISERQVQARQRSLDSARQTLSSVRRGYEVGTRDLIDVLDRETKLYAAQRNYSEARYDSILSLLQLKALAGRLSGEDLQALNAWLAAPTTPFVRGASRVGWMPLAGGARAGRAKACCLPSCRATGSEQWRCLREALINLPPRADNSSRVDCEPTSQGVICHLGKSLEPTG